MTDRSTAGYEAEPTDVAAEVSGILGDLADPVERYHRATAAQVHHQAVVDALAAERAKVAAELWDGGNGLSFTKIADALLLGSKARAQQLVERGRT
jgi:hypothetical protein